MSNAWKDFEWYLIGHTPPTTQSVRRVRTWTDRNRCSRESNRWRQHCSQRLLSRLHLLRSVQVRTLPTLCVVGGMCPMRYHSKSFHAFSTSSAICAWPQVQVWPLHWLLLTRRRSQRLPVMNKPNPAPAAPQPAPRLRRAAPLPGSVSPRRGRCHARCKRWSVPPTQTQPGTAPSVAREALSPASSGETSENQRPAAAEVDRVFVPAASGAPRRGRSSTSMGLRTSRLPSASAITPQTSFCRTFPHSTLATSTFTSAKSRGVGPEPLGGGALHLPTERCRRPHPPTPMV